MQTRPRPGFDYWERSTGISSENLSEFSGVYAITADRGVLNSRRMRLQLNELRIVLM